MRAVVAALAAIFLAAGAVSAASPDLIGGKLTAGTTTVTLTSQATIPVMVSMHPDGPFTLDRTTFTLDPGETVTIAISGSATGRVSATLRALVPPVGGELASVTLEVAFAAPVPAAPSAPADLPIVLLGAATLILVGLVLALRWLRPWRWRIVRT